MSTQGIQQSDTTWRWWALGFVLTGYLVVFAGVTNMNVALPAAQAELGFTDAARQWVITLYALCFGALMVPGGRLGDVIGLQRCITGGITGFAAASLIGGLAGNTQVLLAGRALQGATGALVAATGLALLSVMFPDGPARARAFGALGTVMGLGTAGSFLLAGALVDGLSWRWTLLINVPVAAVVVAGLSRTVPPGTTAPAAPRGPRLDLFGAALITAALALLVTGFDRAGVLGWAAPATVTLLLAGLVLALLLIGWLRRAENPLIPPALLADRQRGAAFAAVFVAGIGMFAGLFFLTVYLQDVLGYSALATGLAFLPFGAGALVVSHLLGTPRAARVPPRTPLVLGLLTTASALGGFAVIDPAAGYAAVIPMMLLLGAGGTAVMVTGAGAATLGTGPDSGVAGALVNSGQQVGAALGTALLTAIAAGATARRAGGGSGPADGEALLHGYALAGVLGAGLTVAAALGVLLLGRRQDEATAEQNV